ncbi:hypothetical protein Sjap_026306 [Stephania japonica]|uniref:Uncharacterized protein n=1 Tax=Stephania japonica TaxID=461633 RepID=A0AAP0E5W1_9MAGN
MCACGPTLFGPIDFYTEKYLEDVLQSAPCNNKIIVFGSGNVLCGALSVFLSFFAGILLIFLVTVDKL